MTSLEREAPIDPAHAALLTIDVQNYCYGEEACTTGYFRHRLRVTMRP